VRGRAGVCATGAVLLTLIPGEYPAPPVAQPRLQHVERNAEVTRIGIGQVLVDRRGLGAVTTCALDATTER
jgi:hypothetical protein